MPKLIELPVSLSGSSLSGQQAANRRASLRFPRPLHQLPRVSRSLSSNMALLPPSWRGPGSSRFAAGGGPARLLKKKTPPSGVGVKLPKNTQTGGGQARVLHRGRGGVVGEGGVESGGGGGVVVG